MTLTKKTRTAGFGEEVQRRIMIGTHVLSGVNAHKYYKKALALRNVITKSFNNALEKYDLIIGPTNTSVAYNFGVTSDDALKTFTDDILTNPVNMTGLTALSMPVGFNSENLPIGMHIIGAALNEATIYSLGYFLEQKLNLNTNPEVK